LWGRTVRVGWPAQPASSQVLHQVMVSTGGVCFARQCLLYMFMEILFPDLRHARVSCLFSGYIEQKQSFCHVRNAPALGSCAVILRPWQYCCIASVFSFFSSRPATSVCGFLRLRGTAHADQVHALERSAKMCFCILTRGTARLRTKSHAAGGDQQGQVVRGDAARAAAVLQSARGGC
jgi:hypothetical protein